MHSTCVGETVFVGVRHLFLFAKTIPVLRSVLRLPRGRCPNL
jgi:hypothetical protein